jgi:hypothetical protein
MEHQNLIRKIVAEGQKNGYLTYSELNTMLPEDLASSPEQLDEIIGVLDERGIELIDDGDSSGLDLVAAGEDPLDIEDRKAQQAKEFESGQEEGPVSDPEGGRTNYEDAKRKLQLYRRIRQPPPGGLDRQEVPQPRPELPGHDPGGQHRPDAAVDKYEYKPRLQVLAPTPPGGSARPSPARSPTRPARSASRCT